MLLSAFYFHWLLPLLKSLMWGDDNTCDLKGTPSHPLLMLWNAPFLTDHTHKSTWTFKVQTKVTKRGKRKKEINPCPHPLNNHLSLIHKVKHCYTYKAFAFCKCCVQHPFQSSNSSVTFRSAHDPRGIGWKDSLPLANMWVLESLNVKIKITRIFETHHFHENLYPRKLPTIRYTCYNMKLYLE